MDDVSCFGLVLNSDGEPVDIVYTERVESIPFGGSTVLIATSTSQTGRCIVAKDPTTYYEIHYWVDFRTYSGELATRYAVERGKAWDYEDVWEQVAIEYIGVECEADDHIVIVQLANTDDSPHSIVPGVKVYADDSMWSREHGWWSTDENPVELEPHSTATLRYLVGGRMGHIGGEPPPPCGTVDVIGHCLWIKSIDGVDYDMVKKTTHPESYCP